MRSSSPTRFARTSPALCPPSLLPSPNALHHSFLTNARLQRVHLALLSSTAFKPQNTKTCLSARRVGAHVGQGGGGRLRRRSRRRFTRGQVETQGLGKISPLRWDATQLFAEEKQRRARAGEAGSGSSAGRGGHTPKDMAEGGPCVAAEPQKRRCRARGMGRLVRRTRHLFSHQTLSSWLSWAQPPRAPHTRSQCPPGGGGTAGSRGPGVELSCCGRQQRCQRGWAGSSCS